MTLPRDAAVLCQARNKLSIIMLAAIAQCLGLAWAAAC